MNNPVLNQPFEFVFCAIFSLSVVLGKYLDKGQSLSSLSYLQMLSFLVKASFVYLITVGIVRMYCNWLVSCRKNHHRAISVPVSDLKVFTLAFIGIMLCWGIVWLAYYPGLLNYDPWQVDQVLSSSYKREHPLLHTLLLGNLYKFGLSKGNVAIGIMIYDLVQSTILAASVSLAYTMIRKRSSTRILPNLTIAFYCLHPANAIMAISTTKDVLFSAFVLLSLLISITLLNGKEKHQTMLSVFMVITLLLTALFKNGAIVFLIYCAVVSLFKIRKLYWKRLFIIFTTSICLFFGVDGFLANTFHAEPIPKKEMLNVVAQQFGRIHTYIDDPETQQQIDKYVSFTTNKYRPYIADPVKHYFREDVEKQIGEVLKLSKELFFRFPLMSIDSLLYTTKGFWHIGDITFSRITGLGNRIGGYLQTVIREDYGLSADSKIPWLEQFLERIVSDNKYEHIPIISILFSPAFYTYIFMFTFLGLKSLKSKYTACLPTFIIMSLAMFLCPCIIVRYVFCFMICSPVFVWLLQDQIDSAQYRHADSLCDEPDAPAPFYSAGRKPV